MIIALTTNPHSLSGVIILFVVSPLLLSKPGLAAYALSLSGISAVDSACRKAAFSSRAPATESRIAH